MRLYEISSHHKLVHDINSIVELQDKAKWFRYLNKNGYKNIGQGSAGEVYARPFDPYVIKIVYHGDECYKRFVKFSLQNKENKHLPKIYYVKNLDDKGFVVGIEKLQTLNLETQIYIILDIFEGTVNQAIEIGSKNIIQLFFKNIDETQDIDKFEVKKVLYEHKELFKTIVQLKRLLIPNCTFDFYARNFMKRQDETIVITDPFFG